MVAHLVLDRQRDAVEELPLDDVLTEVVEALAATPGLTPAWTADPTGSAPPLRARTRSRP